MSDISNTNGHAATSSRPNCSNSIEQRIFDNTKNAEAGDAQNVLERVRASASAISAELMRDRAYADVQAATANLMVSLGLDPLPAEVPGHDIKALSAAFTAMNVNWESGQLVPPAPAPVPRPYRCQCQHRCRCRRCH